MQKPNFFVLAALTCALAALFVIVPAHAGPHAHGPKAGKRLQKLSSELGLTNAQKAQMKPVLQAARQQAKAIKDNATLSADDRKSRLKELRKSTRQQTLAVLTPDQRAKLKSIRLAKREAKQGAF